MIQIKNLSDFKKALKIGAKLHTVNANVGDMGIREVSIVQSNSFALSSVRDGKQVNSWCEYGKASNWIFDGTNVCRHTWEVNGKQEIILTYTFVD